MRRLKKQSGVILPTMMVTMAVLMVTVTGLYSYISTVRRNVQTYAAYTYCRLIAQSSLDQISYNLYYQFNAYNVNNPSIPNPLQYFETWSSGTVGVGTYAVAMPNEQLIYDAPSPCTVTVVVPTVSSTGMNNRQPGATITLRATASMQAGSGVTVAKTIEQVVKIGLDRSTVFDYAYFINNFGWFQGGGVTANGPIRANGNMQLDGNSKVNGDVYASINPLLGAAGYIENSFKYDTLSSYWSSAGTRARPTDPTSYNGLSWAMGYDGSPTANAYQDAVSMPYLGDLQLYVTMAKEQGGTIKQGGVTLVDAEYSGAGPSGDITAVDKGCLVLDGTKTPIEINGPVVVDGDVIIKGTVTGQGTIYAGRNIHIVGDVAYEESPAWVKPDTDPEATVTVNSTKDMLGLAAKGNIVIGDSTQSSWHTSSSRYDTDPDYYYGKPDSWGNQFTHAYECDPTDAAIGYPSTFDGNYTAEDGLKKVAYEQVAVGITTNTYWRWGRQYTSYSTVYSNKVSKTDSHYYDSLIGDDALTKLASASMTSAGKIQQIDAVLYNNHAIMGHVGACVINGSLVSRDEAIIYSSSLKINWDIRLGTQSKDGMNFFINLPVSPARPQVVSWREI